MRPFILLLLCAGAAHAQGVVGGRVLDETSAKPLACIEVALVNAADRMVARTRTRPDGSFEFAAPELGVYRLAFLMSRHTPLYSAPDSLTPSTDKEQTYRVALEFDPSPSGYVDSEAAGLWFTEPGQPTGASPRDFGARHLDGFVVARYAIGLDGRVIPTSVDVLYSSAPAYDRAFRASILQTRFITSRFPEREPLCVMLVVTPRWGEGSMVLPGKPLKRPSGSIRDPGPPQ